MDENDVLENFTGGDTGEYQDGEIVDVVDPPALTTETIDAASGNTTTSTTDSTSKAIAEQVIEVNLVPGGVYPIIRCSKDDNGYQIRFKIFHGNEPLDLNAEGNALAVSFQMTKTNGVFYSCNLTKLKNLTGQCFMWLSKDATDIPGDHFCELVVTNASGRKIGTANMILAVERGTINKKTATVTTDTINSLHDAVGLINKINAYEENLAAYKQDLDDHALSVLYSRTWSYGKSFGGLVQNKNFCIAYRSGYTVTVSFAVKCTIAMTVAADNRAIIKNLPKALHRVYLAIPIIHFTYSAQYGKNIPDGIKGDCICTMRPEQDDKGAILQVDGSLNPTEVKVDDVLYGTFSYVTSELS